MSSDEHQDWLEERRNDVYVELENLKERVDAMFTDQQDRRTKTGRRRIDKLAAILGKVLRPSPRLGRRAR